jgi:pimeloyl-ACP methyl ester carboxylesterase
MRAGLATRTDIFVEGIRATVWAAGPPADEAAVVFVHGNPGSGRTWEPLIGPVSTFARCVAPDMPGYGDTDKPTRFDFGVAGYAAHLGAVLDALEIRRAHLVVHDLGGPWGLGWAASSPERLASLTLIGIGALPGYQWHRFARAYRIPVVGELVLRTASRRAVARALGLGSRRGVPDEFVDDVIAQYRDPGTRRAALGFYRSTPDLGAVTVAAAEAIRPTDPPTLVVWGGGDPYVPARFANVQAEFFSRAKVVVLPESGHYPLVDDPEAVADAVVPFLRASMDADGG